MTERTVTEQQVIAALEKLGHTAYQLTITANIMIELFPKLPKMGELVLTSDKGSTSVGGWLPFVKIRDDGRVIVLDEDGNDELWDNYRSQTPAERGEGNE
jgi:hypothetical protein